MNLVAVTGVLTSMTTLGHGLTGMSIGVLCLPRSWRPFAAATMLIGFAVVANIPDARIPYWGHHRYNISHSLLSNLVLIALAATAAVVISRGIKRPIRPALLIGGGAACLSHLLLDSFYNHGRGIGIGWPMGRLRLNLSIPWFNVHRRKWSFSTYTARILLIELAFYGTLLVLCIAIRIWWARRLRHEKAHG